MKHIELIMQIKARKVPKFCDNCGRDLTGDIYANHGCSNCDYKKNLIDEIEYQNKNNPYSPIDEFDLWHFFYKFDCMRGSRKGIAIRNETTIRHEYASYFLGWLEKRRYVSSTLMEKINDHMFIKVNIFPHRRLNKCDSNRSLTGTVSHGEFCCINVDTAKPAFYGTCMICRNNTYNTLGTLGKDIYLRDVWYIEGRSPDVIGIDFKKKYVSITIPVVCENAVCKKIYKWMKTKKSHLPIPKIKHSQKILSATPNDWKNIYVLATYLDYVAKIMESGISSGNLNDCM